jgi:hypothetical protein
MHPVASRARRSSASDDQQETSVSHMPTPAHAHPTPIWLGWLIDASELDVQRWAAERKRGRQSFVRRSRTLAWATLLACIGWQVALVQRAGGGVRELFTTGDPALFSVGGTIVVLVYAVGSLQWWLHERKYRRLMRQQRSGRLEA